MVIGECPSCKILQQVIIKMQEKLEKEQECKSCEILKVELENERFEKRQLLNKIAFPPEEKKLEINEKELKPIYPRHTPWSVQQALLEKEDREKAKILAELAALDKQGDAKKTTEELEEELLFAKDTPRAQSGGIVAQVEPLSEKDFEEVDASKVS